MRTKLSTLTLAVVAPILCAGLVCSCKTAATSTSAQKSTTTSTPLQFTRIQLFLMPSQNDVTAPQPLPVRFRVVGRYPDGGPKLLEDVTDAQFTTYLPNWLVKSHEVAQNQIVASNMNLVFAFDSKVGTIVGDFVKGTNSLVIIGDIDPATGTVNVRPYITLGLVNQVTKTSWLERTFGAMSEALQGTNYSQPPAQVSSFQPVLGISADTDTSTVEIVQKDM
jgi:hypothetical protein